MSAADYLAKFGDLTLLIVGDVMLDAYERVEARDTEEEFGPAYVTCERTVYPGGAANAALIAHALGASVGLIGAVGNDTAGAELMRVLAGRDRLAYDFLRDDTRETTVKTRVSVGYEPYFRRDAGSIVPLTMHGLAKILPSFDIRVDAVLLSDYDKGMFRTPGVIEAALATAPIRVLDPKRSYGPFEGVQYATPNAREAGRFAGVHKALLEMEGTKVVETRGDQGVFMHTLDLSDFETVEYPTVPVKPVSVVGAGDAFAAGFTLALAAGALPGDAITVGQGVARAWVSKAREDVLNLEEVAAHVDIVEAAQS